jgi:hypothetical protein
MIMQMRERGADAFEGYDGKVKQVEALQAEVAALKTEIARLTSADLASPTLVDAGDNVVPLARPPASAAPAPAAPSKPFVNGTSDLVASYPAPDEPWRAFANRNYDRWSDNR